MLKQILSMLESEGTMTMKRVLNEELVYEVLSAVEEIPKGCVWLGQCRV